MSDINALVEWLRWAETRKDLSRQDADLMLSAADEIERLRAERDELRANEIGHDARMEVMRDTVSSLQNDVADLIRERDEWKEKADWQAEMTRAFMRAQEEWVAERDALRADAERYRWLRMKEVRVYQDRDPYGCIMAASELALDDAIDRAKGGRK